MPKKNIKNDLSENSYTDIENENEIIEEIINNSLLGEEEEEEKEEEYDEEEYIEEENLSEKENKNIEDKKDNNINNNNIENYKKKKSIQYKDIIENLLIELFEFHYTEISKDKKKYLTKKILESKYHIEFFCSRLSINFPKYIIYRLEQKINELIEYVINKINENQNVTLQEILKIKQNLKLTGKDINKIFEKPFQKTKNFDMPSVLVVLFIGNILNGSFAEKISDEDYEQIIEIESIEEKDIFEKYVEKCKLSLSIMDEDEEKEEKKEEIEENEEKVQKNEEIEENKIIFPEFEVEKQNNNIIIEHIEQNIDNNNKNIIIKSNNINDSKHSMENISKNNSDNNININKKNVDEKPQNLNLEDLMKYINGNDNKKKKKKKRKKRAKVKNIEEEKKEEDIEIEKDIIFENFKSNLIDFSNGLKNFKKIKPKISDAFLEKLKSIN